MSKRKAKEAEMVEELLREMTDKKVHVDEEQLIDVYCHIRDKDFEEAKLLIIPETRHLPLCVSNVRGAVSWDAWPLLHFAARQGGYTIIEYLLDGGADIELQSIQVRVYCLFFHFTVCLMNTLVWIHASVQCCLEGKRRVLRIIDRSRSEHGCAFREREDDTDRSGYQRTRECV